MNCKSRHKTITTNMSYLGLKVKGRNKRKAKLPSPHQHNPMICAINSCRDASCQARTYRSEKTFLPDDEPDLCNDYILKGPGYIDRFVLTFSVTVYSNKFFWIPIFLTIWF